MDNREEIYGIKDSGDIEPEENKKTQYGNAVSVSIRAS